MARNTAHRIEIVGLDGLPEIRPGDDLVELVMEAFHRNELTPSDGDVIVFTQKIVSKSEGRIAELASVTPSPLSVRFAEPSGRDPRVVEVSLREARRIVKMDRGVLITESRQGLVCANSGIDQSNVPEGGVVSLLPEEPDRSAARLLGGLVERTGKRLAVIVSDTFGRPWREGQTNVAIGLAGMEPFADYRGRHDPGGHELSTTVIAVADELAAAAELVMGKLDRVPVAVVRGYTFTAGDGKARSMQRAPEHDLFR